MPTRLCVAWLAPLWLAAGLLGASAPTPPPIPDIATLMHQVQQHQRDLDQTRENYAFREIQTIDELDKDGKIKKTIVRELQVFFVNTHQIERLVGRYGRPLAASEEAKESERVQREIEKAQKTPPGQLTDAKSQISVGRLLTIEKFSNGRRIMVDKPQRPGL